MNQDTLDLHDSAQSFFYQLQAESDPSQQEIMKIFRKYRSLDDFYEFDGGSFSIPWLPAQTSLLQQPLQLEIELSPHYPKVTPSFSSSHPTLPFQTHQVIAKSLKLEARKRKGSPMLFALLRWLDLNFEYLLQLGRDVRRIQREKLTKAHGRLPDNDKSQQEAFLRVFLVLFIGVDRDFEGWLSNSIPRKESRKLTLWRDELRNSPLNPTPVEISLISSTRWTEEQQNLLEDAMRSVPKSIGPRERWIEIANLVGRSPKECVARVRAIKKKLVVNKKSPPIEATAKESGAGSETAENIEAPEEVIPSGIAIELTDPDLSGIAFFKAPTINLRISCDRCHEITVVNELDIRPNQIQCHSCKVNFAIRYKPALVHQQNRHVGYLDLERCSIIEVLPLTIIVACFECFGESTVRRHGPLNRKKTNCRTCYNSMGMYYTGYRYPRAGKSIALDLKDAKKRKLKMKRLKYEVGKPLPSFGACKHYRNSFRHFRYPCCDMVYACEKCHAKNSDHEYKWATKQLCGYCSKEQSTQNKFCCNKKCGKSFTRARTSHWEGGKGCRDQKRMARTEKKKYAGKNKTISNKARNKKKK